MQGHGVQFDARQFGHAGGAAIDGQSVQACAAVVRQDVGDGKALADVALHLGSGQQGQGGAAFAQHQQAGDVVNLRVHQQHRSNAAVAQGACGLQRWGAGNLGQDVG